MFFEEIPKKTYVITCRFMGNAYIWQVKAQNLVIKHIV